MEVTCKRKDLSCELGKENMRERPGPDKKKDKRILDDVAVARLGPENDCECG